MTNQRQHAIPSLWNPWNQQQQSPPHNQPPPKLGQQQGQLPAIPISNPTIRASRCGGEGGPEKENRALEAPRKVEPHSQETARTLLIAPMNLIRLFWPEPQLTLGMMTIYLQTIYKLHEAKQKARERKRLLWQLLLQRSGAQVTPTVLVVAGLSSSAPFVTAT